MHPFYPTPSADRRALYGNASSTLYIEKIFLNSIWNHKRFWITNATLSRQNKATELQWLENVLQSYYSTQNNMVLALYTPSRIERPGIYSHIYSEFTYEKFPRTKIREKNLLENCTGKKWICKHKRMKLDPYPRCRWNSIQNEWKTKHKA